MSIVAGIDVGGKKGLHCVALKNGKIHEPEQFTSAHEAAEWCRRVGAEIVGIDAPCRWSAGRCGRRAEKDLRDEAKLHSFSTPCEGNAAGNPFYGWMLNGADLYLALGKNYPLYDGNASKMRFCFETYPHAIAWALAGRALSAREKRRNRPPLLENEGIRCDLLTNADWIDAALCALTARCVQRQEFRSFGDLKEGFILVPRAPQALCRFPNAPHP